MIVRWISLDPPGIVHSHEPMKSSTHEPDSHPLRRRLHQFGVRRQAADLGAEVRHALQKLAVEQLHHRRVGGSGGARLGVLDELPAQPAQTGDLDVELCQPVGDDRIVGGAGLHQPPEACVAETLRELQHGHPALCAQRRLSHLPSGILVADEVGGRDLDIVEEHLAEVGVADRIADGPHLDAWAGHVQQKVRNTFALGGFDVGAGQQQAPVRVLAAACPQLLAVDDVAVADLARRGAQARQVRTRLRFGEALHPDLAVEDGGKVSAALLVCSGDQQSGCGMVDPDKREDEPGRVVSGELGVQNDLFGDGHAAAPLFRPVRNGVARCVQLGEPPLLEPDEFLVVDAGLSRAPIGWNVLLTPGAHAGAELVEVGCVTRTTP